MLRLEPLGGGRGAVVGLGRLLDGLVGLLLLLGVIDLVAARAVVVGEDVVLVEAVDLLLADLADRLGLSDVDLAVRVVVGAALVDDRVRGRGGLVGVAELGTVEEEQQRKISELEQAT